MFPKVVYTDDVTVINAQNLNDIQDAIIQHDADIDGKSDQDGYYEDMTVGMAEELVGTTFIEDDTPYQIRKSGGGVEVGAREYLNKLVGGSLGWNQLIQNGDFSSGTTGWTPVNSSSTVVSSGVVTLTKSSASGNLQLYRGVSQKVAGHKILISLEAQASTNVTLNLYWGALIKGVAVTTTKQKFSVVGVVGSGDTDFNLMVINMPTGGTASYSNIQLFDLTVMFGSTIADYVYGLESATAGAGVAWLRKYIDLGTYHAYDAGSIQSVQATAHVTTGKNLMPQQTDGIIPCFLPKGAYICASCTTPTGATPNLNYYDANRNRIDYWPLTQTYSGGIYRSFVVLQDAYYIAFTNNTALNKQLEYGSAPTAYEPYTAHTYPLGSDTLRGVPRLVNNKLKYDGDEKYPDGTIKRKYGIVDLGTLTFTANGTITGGYQYVATIPNKAYGVDGFICPKFAISISNELWTMYGRAANAIISFNSTESTAAAFKTAMSGVYLVYPLATETTESSTAYQKIQTINKDGMEQFVCTSPVPVGHYTQYPKDLWSTLDKLADIFTPPTANGTYTLKVTVNNGVAIYRWVSD